MAHRNLEIAARDAGQEILVRGPRGGFCNGAGTFEQLMDCLVASLDAAGSLANVELLIDVHASRLVPPSAQGEESNQDEDRSTGYDLTVFSSESSALELTSAQALLDIYLEWLEKYPITAFVEPFAAADIATSKELLIRGNQILQAKAAAPSGAPSGEAGDPAGSPTGEASGENSGSVDNVEVSAGDENCLFRIIADESATTLSQLVFVNEQRGANAILINTPKFSTVSDMVTITSRARELGWAVAVATVDEQELEGDFYADFGVGLRAEQLLLGGLRSASTIAACTRLMRIEDEGVPHVGMGDE